MLNEDESLEEEDNGLLELNFNHQYEIDDDDGIAMQKAYN
jgi:hypothetical protein